MGVDRECGDMDERIEGKEQHEGHNASGIHNKHGVQNNNCSIRSD